MNEARHRHAPGPPRAGPTLPWRRAELQRDVAWLIHGGHHDFPHDPDRLYGVTTPLWDLVFATHARAPRARGAAASSGPR